MSLYWPVKRIVYRNRCEINYLAEVLWLLANVFIKEVQLWEKIILLNSWLIEAKTKKQVVQIDQSESHDRSFATIVIIPVGLGLVHSQYQASDSIKQAVLGTVAALVSMIPEVDAAADEWHLL